MMEKNNEHVRFSEAPWYRLAKQNTVVIGGAGGIGSWLSLFLSRMGVSLNIYDMDTYDTTNIGGQFVKISTVGLNKAKALKKNIRDFSSNPKINVYGKYENGSMGHKFMFSGFDNMKARKLMFNNWLDYSSVYTDAIFIDGRLLMEQIQIFCVTPSNKGIYESEYLFDDSEVEDESCTMKQTSHSAAMIASFMTGFFTNHLANIEDGNTARNVPFKFEYFIPLNMMTDGIR